LNHVQLNDTEWTNFYKNIF